VLRPLAYPVAYAFEYLLLAFQNSDEPVLAEYWRGYPNDCFEIGFSSAILGFPTLKRWLLEGF
jgi:hypothetical protein